MSGTVFVISAPSGGGKTSLVHAVLKRLDKLTLSISYTTRPQRKEEENKVHYHFVTVAQFQTMLAQDTFLEHAKVFDNYYGTSRLMVEKSLNAGEDVLLEIDWQGAVQIKQKIPNAVMIFLLPPSIEILRERLEHRGMDSPQVIAKRIAQAMAEMKQYHRFDYLVVNDNFEQAVDDLQNIIQAQRLGRAYQQQHLAALLTRLGL